MIDNLQSIRFNREVHEALNQKHPLVALESSVTTQGLPFPDNLHIALELEEAIRNSGAIPMTIAIIEGQICYGLETAELENLAKQPSIKVSRRDLAYALHKKLCGGTTVSSTAFLAQSVGCQVFATGGIGGVHRQSHVTGDVSADLYELTRSPIMVVCAGAKSILDLAKTLELLETLGIPVAGFRSDEFPAFFSDSSGLKVPFRCETADELASFWLQHRIVNAETGMIVTNPIEKDHAINLDVIENHMIGLQEEVERKSIKGNRVTPYLLQRLVELTNGKSLKANKSLLVANAKLASEIAYALHRSQHPSMQL